MPKIARADVIGSLLRPPYLQDARKAAREGRLDSAEARAAEDRAITEAIALQESAGMDAVVPVSPMPPGGSPLWITWTSIGGT